MLSVAAEDYLKELLDKDTLERSRILNVFMTEELISRKDRFAFEDTTYVIGTLTRNRLLGKKQSRNQSFVSNAVYIEMGQLNLLIEAILAKEEELGEGYPNEESEEDLGCEGTHDFSVFIDDLELPDDSDEIGTAADGSNCERISSGLENARDATLEHESKDTVDCMPKQLVCAAGVPFIRIHYIPRKNLNVFTEGVMAGPISYTMAEVQQRVREYFEC